MPNFELVDLRDAELTTNTGKRAELMREYVGYIDRLQPGKAGKLQVTEGETPSAVRRRLGAAAKMSGRDLVIKRTGDDIYFWVSDSSKTSRRRGRPPRRTALQGE